MAKKTLTSIANGVVRLKMAMNLTFSGLMTDAA